MKHLTLLLLALAFFGCNKAKITELESKLASTERENELIRSQLETVQRTNGDLLNRMEDLSVISKEGRHEYPGKPAVHQRANHPHQ